MPTKKELLEENARLKRRLKRKKTRTRGISSDEMREIAREETRRAAGNRAYQERYNGLVRQGLCGRCASRPCVCEWTRKTDTIASCALSTFVDLHTAGDFCFPCHCEELRSNLSLYSVSFPWKRESRIKQDRTWIPAGVYTRSSGAGMTIQKITQIASLSSQWQTYQRLSAFYLQKSASLLPYFPIFSFQRRDYFFHNSVHFLIR